MTLVITDAQIGKLRIFLEEHLYTQSVKIGRTQPGVKGLWVELFRDDKAVLIMEDGTIKEPVG